MWSRACSSRRSRHGLATPRSLKGPRADSCRTRRGWPIARDYPVPRGVLAGLVMFLFLSPGFPSFGEDLKIVYRLSLPHIGKPYEIVQYFSTEWFRLSASEFDLITNLNTRDTIYIDHGEKLYYEVAFEEARAHILAKAKKGREYVRAIESYLEALRIRPASGVREIAGYPCREYTMDEEKGRVTVSLWATSELKMPIEYYEIARLLNAFLGVDFDNMFNEMRSVGSVPVAWTVEGRLRGIKLVSVTTEASEIVTGQIPARTFDLIKPKGYKKKHKFRRR